MKGHKLTYTGNEILNREFKLIIKSRHEVDFEYQEPKRPRHLFINNRLETKEQGSRTRLNTSGVGRWRLTKEGPLLLKFSGALPGGSGEGPEQREHLGKSGAIIRELPSPVKVGIVLTETDY